MSGCQGCGTELAQKPTGARRKWCSERCRRRTLYSRECIDCGEPTDGSNGAARAPERCAECTKKLVHRTAVDRMIEAMHDWHDIFGVPPTSVDWNQAYARNLAKTAPAYSERVIRRYESTGRDWPPTAGVTRLFGSWRAALTAAGFEPISDKDKPLGYLGRQCRDEDMAA